MHIDNILSAAFNDHKRLTEAVQRELTQLIKDACLVIQEAITKGNKLLLIGNGGSAADAQHIAAEFTGRFFKERIPLPAIALTTDTSALTAISNDYGYDTVFARQVTALGNKGDVLIAISTSGNSPSITHAVNTARQKGIICIGLTGKDGGALRDICEISLIIPSTITARIQEMHILIGHLFCEYIDSCY